MSNGDATGQVLDEHIQYCFYGDTMGYMYILTSKDKGFFGPSKIDNSKIGHLFLVWGSRDDRPGFFFRVFFADFQANPRNGMMMHWLIAVTSYFSQYANHDTTVLYTVSLI